MKRISTAIIVLSTALMLLVILGSLMWATSVLASGSLARGLFVGGFTIAGATLSVWLGIRVAQPLVRRNREYVERMRRKRDSS